MTFPVLPGGPDSELPPSQRNWEMTRQDGEGRIVERTIWIGDGKALTYRAEIPGQYTLEVDNTHALARGADGQLQLIAANQMDNGSWTVIVPPGQTLVTNGLQSIALPTGAGAQTLSLATALTAPLALPQGAALSDTAAALGRTVIGWAPAALRALGTIGLALWPSELGGGETVVALNDNARIVKPTSDVVYGHLELRDEAGQWQRVQERQFNPAEAAALLAAQRTSMLTPAELQRLTGPMIHVPAPPLPPLPGHPALPDDERQPPVLPGATVDRPPVPSVLPGAPIETPSWADSIVERSNSKKLGEALEAAGQPRPFGYEPHHIVPSGAGGTDMADLRVKLQGFGIDLDSAVNGIWLPGPNAPLNAPEAYHRTLNNDVYNKTVLDEFKDVNDQARAITILADIAEQLKSGTFPGVRPRP